MRHAPPVRVRCPGRGPWLWTRIALVASAAGVVAAWALAHAESPDPWLLIGALAAAALSAAVVRRLADTEDVEVEWDGGAWQLHAGQRGTRRLDAVHLMMDLGLALLLRLRWSEGGAGERWLMVSAREAGESFRDLCAALYAGSGPADGRPASPEHQPR